MTAPGYMTALEAAMALGTSAVTVRALLARGELTGSKEQRGSRFRWRVDTTGVSDYLYRYGRVDQRRASRGGGTIAQLREDLARLRAELHRLGNAEPAVRERDGLRVEVVRLREAVLQQRHAAEFVDMAAAARADAIEHLAQAIAGMQRADGLQRMAGEALNEALIQFVLPGSWESGT